MELLEPQDSATMIHYQCGECEMNATCVMNRASALAWVHHMDTHGPKAGFDSWVWDVVPLPFIANDE